MATIKKGKVTVSFLGIIGILLIAVWLLVPSIQAEAKTMKFKYTSQLTRVELAPVPDVEGHVVVLYVRRGVAIFENEVAPFMTMGTADLVKRLGPFQGYSQITFKDGSTVNYDYTGALTLAPGAKLRSLKGKGKFIKGTGRFEGIKGEVSFTGRYITPITKDKTKGDNWMEVTGTYTLPKK
jgi:hypothetical protein